jgi:hypothetical protein
MKERPHNASPVRQNRRDQMKKHAYAAWIILLSLFITGCQGSFTSQLEATNQALSNQVSTLMNQLTQQAAPQLEPTRAATSASPESNTPIQPAPTSTSPASASQADGITPSLIFSGSGEITPLSNQKAVTSGIFGAANVHLLCNPNDSEDGQVWIDTKAFSVSCIPNSESWFPWKQDLTVGDHYIYSVNAADQYEFWTIGTTPFSIRNKFARSDFIFRINNAGIYNLSAEIIKGAFNLYITCQGAQNFSYKITQSTTEQLVLNPAMCELLIRDEPPGTLTPGEIVVSLEFVK